MVRRSYTLSPPCGMPEREKREIYPQEFSLKINLNIHLYVLPSLTNTFPAMWYTFQVIILNVWKSVGVYPGIFATFSIFFLNINIV